MERRLKERLIGAAVLVMLAVIFIPMILDDTSKTDVTITETNIPARPEDDFNSRIVPLKESDLTPMSVDPLPEEETEQMVEVTTEPAKPIELNIPVIAEDKKPTPVQTREKGIDSTHMGATAWVVQLGSFGSEENAKKLNEKLRLAGYPAFVEPLKNKSGMAYRVRVGPELLRSDAQALQKKLEKSMQIDGIIIRYP